jgi:hypothetical protein
MKEKLSLETSETTHPTTKRQIPVDLNNTAYCRREPIIGV